VRRLFSRLAVYFGLKDDETPAPPPERPTAQTVVAIVVASLLTGLLLNALKALVTTSDFDLADAVWYGALLSVVMVIARVIAYDARRPNDPPAPRAHE
jgi:hypothetical protein